MSDLVVYTAIFGDIGDQLHTPQNQPDGVEFIAYVDDPSPKTKNGWQLRAANWTRPNKRKQARHHKCLVHELFPDAKMSLWVDGCLTPRQNVRQMAEYLLNGHDICMFEHQERNCVYQEVEACIKLQKDIPDLIRKQVQRYRDDSYPYHNGLAETTAVFRRHTPLIQQLNELWWSEIREHCARDQISVDYCCWKLGIEYAHFEGTRTESPHFTWRPHR